MEYRKLDKKEPEINDDQFLIVSIIIALLSYVFAFLALIGMFQGTTTNWVIAFLGCVGFLPVYNELKKFDRRKKAGALWRVVGGVLMVVSLLFAAAIAFHSNR